MPRPVKPRSISYKPKNRSFEPNKKQNNNEPIILKFEEIEAIRLKDLEKLNQEECAVEMNVSRQTFQLIIEKAREKVADALINGSPINIDGGNYILKSCDKKCNMKKKHCPKCAYNGDSI
jgi:predicted DNA-binding protein (UPF0251 family)